MSFVDNLSFRILGYEPGEDIGSVPRVDAEAKIKPGKEKVDKSSNDELKESSDEESSDSEGEDDGEGSKKKRIKEKVGFRDRKVIISISS